MCTTTHILKNALHAAPQGKRYILPNTSVMLHHPSGTARGQASDIYNEARELMRLRDYVNNVLSIATGQPVEKVRAVCDQRTWWLCMLVSHSCKWSSTATSIWTPRVRWSTV